MKDNCRVDRLHFGTGTGEFILKDACLRPEVISENLVRQVVWWRPSSLDLQSFVNAAYVFPHDIHIHFQEEK
jgi:hypothetical protein